MWMELKIFAAVLYTIFVRCVSELYTYLIEDQNQFVDYQIEKSRAIERFHVPVTVEVAVVCSKGFADNFNQDEKIIADYLTAYFWDMSTRFRTLHQTEISFSVTSLTIIKSEVQQPFIENVRHPIHKSASLDAILPLFQNWIFSNNKSSHISGFDVAMLLIEPGLDRADQGAVAEFQGACNFGIGNEGDTFKSAIVLRAGAMSAAMYEMAILLGATREQTTHCHHAGLIFNPLAVRGLKKDLPEFFSLCIDEQIKDFNKSSQSSCLHTAQGQPIIDPDFDSVLPPSIVEQCRLLSGSRNATALTSNPGNECALTKCFPRGKQTHDSNDAVLISPLANSRCGDGRRCFHGKCISPGFLLTNVGTGTCLFSEKDTLIESVRSFIIDRCHRSPAPSELFQVMQVNQTGKLLRLPCQALSIAKVWKGTSLEKFIFRPKSILKCLDMCLTQNSWVAGLKECDETNPKHIWEFRDTKSNNGEFILYGVDQQKCAYPRLNEFQRFEMKWTEDCDMDNPDVLWKLNPVLPEETCADGDNCVAQLRGQLSLEVNFSNVLNLNVSLQNLNGGVAVAPGVIVSWKSNFTLMRMPKNCFLFPQFHADVHSLKCKVGRMLEKKNETTLVTTLNFNATTHLENHHDKEPHTMGFSVRPTMASRETVSPRQIQQ